MIDRFAQYMNWRLGECHSWSSRSAGAFPLATASRTRIAAATCGSQHACLFDPFLGTHEATS